MAAAASGPRDRHREQTRAQIKEIALAQLAEGGGSAVALTRIAKEIGLSGPALTTSPARSGTRPPTCPTVPPPLCTAWPMPAWTGPLPNPTVTC